MLDPITGISFALGLLGLLVSNLQNTALLANNVREAASNLRRHHRTLCDLHMMLGLWRKTFFHGQVVLNKRRAKLIWGKAGYAELKGRLRDVLKEEQGLLKLLMQDTALSSQEDKQRWRDNVVACRKDSTLSLLLNTELRPGNVKTDIARRLVLALVTGTAVKEAMTNYKASVKALINRSKMHWQIRWGGKAPGTDEVEVSHRAALIANEFAKAVARRYNSDSALATWSLVFDMMEKVPRDCEPQATGDLDMRFFVSSDPFGSADQLRLGDEFVRASWSYDQDKLYEHDGRVAAELRGKLDMHFVADTSDHLLKKRACRARLRAALCIASWVTLLWSCKWVCGIESQHIHYVNDVAAAGPNTIFYEHPLHPVTPEQQLHHRDIDLLLGVLLAELALGKHIRIVGGPRVQVTSDDLQSTLELEELSESLLDGKTRSYYRAVKHCFWSYRQNCHHNRAGRRAQYIDEVIKPLQDYYTDMTR